MANTSSARKRIRSAARKHDRNRTVRSAVRTAVAKARRAVTVAAEDGADLGRLAVSALDKAAEHGVIHPRNASRRKSRLMRLMAAQSGAEAAVESARRPAARGTRGRAATSGRKAATGKAKPVTKTERTAQRTRRSAGGSADRD